MRDGMAGFIRRNRVELVVLSVALLMALLTGTIFLGFGQASGLDQVSEVSQVTENATDATTSPVGGVGTAAGNAQPEAQAGGEDGEPPPQADINARTTPTAAAPATSAPAAQAGNGSGSQASAPPQSSDDSSKIHVMLAIDSGSRRLELPVSLEEGSTVFRLLQQASSQYGFSLGYSDDSSYGAFIEELDGVRNDPGSGSFWLYYVNGNYAILGASSQTLSEGDVILWRYENTH